MKVSGRVQNMTEEQFLSELREAMEGSVSPSFVNENIRYYEEYISTERQKGRSDEDIMGLLGDPRLIARTLVDTADREDKRGAKAIVDPDGNDDGWSGEGTPEGDIHIRRFSGTKALLIIAAIILIFIAVFIAALVLIGSFIAAFWPALLVVAVVWWILNPMKYE